MVLVRTEQPGDCRAIHEIHRHSFPTNIEAQLVDALRAAGRLSVSLIAEADQRIVGHIAFSPVTVTAGHVGAGLAPISVESAYRRLGIAAELVTTGLRACRAAGFTWAVVLGDPRYYSRFGFLPGPDFGLTDEYGGGTAFQVLELAPGSLPRSAGLVRYAHEFQFLTESSKAAVTSTKKG
ncbi:MAG: N-acetyltransferase [Planctomycetes bacterium]|nr:N-acetyltransferase [Planctomycetota bacterium]